MRELGAGPPLLLLNGYAAAKGDWDPALLDQLSAVARLICPDNRGVGDSTAATEDLSVAEMADDTRALMDVLELETAVVAGWSMGGFVAQELAARAPERVERLVLLATDPGGANSVRTPAEVEARLFDHSGTPREQATRMLHVLFPEQVAAEMDSEFGELVAEARAALSPAALSAQESAMDRWHREADPGRLAAIAAPTLIAHGTEDAVIPFANAERLATGIAGSRLVPFEGGGHAFMAQEPQRLGQLIAAFLSP